MQRNWSPSACTISGNATNSAFPMDGGAATMENSSMVVPQKVNVKLPYV